MREIITLNKDGSHRLIFEAEISNRVKKEIAVEYKVLLSIKEYYKDELYREEYKMSDYTSKGDLDLNISIIKDSESEKWILRAENNQNPEELSFVGLFSSRSNKESYYMNSEIMENNRKYKDSLDYFTTKSSISKEKEDYDLEVLDQTIVFEKLRTSKIPLWIESNSANFNTNEAAMRYKDFVVTPPQHIPEGTDFELSFKVAPLETNTPKGELFQVVVNDLIVKVFNTFIRISKKDSSQAEDIHVVFPRKIEPEDLYAHNDFTKRTNFSIKGTKDGLLSVKYNIEESEQFEFDIGDIYQIHFDGAVKGKSQDGMSSFKVDSRVADLVLRLKK